MLAFVVEVAWLAAKRAEAVAAAAGLWEGKL
jgi:hypothetical protein